MTQLFRKFRKFTSRFRRDSDGNATIEFLFILPVFMVIFTTVFESGLLMTKYMMLERAVDIAVRDVRLSDGVGITHETLVTDICSNALIFTNCSNILLLELVPVPMDGTIGAIQPNCIDRDSEIAPVINFTPGMADFDVMLVRACIVVDPMFPGTGLGLALNKDASGGYAMTATSAFVNEPAS